MTGSLHTSTEYYRTTRIPFEILFVVLIGAIVFPFALGIQYLHENEKTAKYSGSCIQLT